MAKLIKIDDRKPLEIFLGRITQGPICMRLDENVILRLLKAVDGPSNIYALNPENKSEFRKITLDNYMIPEKEMFAKEQIEEKIDYNVEAIKEPVNVIEKSEDTKSTEEVEEPSTPIEEVVETPAAVEEPVVEETEVEEEKVEVKKEETVVASVKKPYQKNYQKNYNKNRK